MIKVNHDPYSMIFLAPPLLPRMMSSLAGWGEENSMIKLDQIVHAKGYSGDWILRTLIWQC